MVGMGVICILGFTAFAHDSHDFGARSGIVLTLLLTAVAFKMSVADTLPKVSYMTKMDMFFNLNALLLVLILLENFAVAALGLSVTTDKVLGVTTFVGWIGFLTIVISRIVNFLRVVSDDLGVELNREESEGDILIKAQQRDM